MNEKKKFRIMVFIVIVLTAITVAEGFIIYKQHLKDSQKYYANNLNDLTSSLLNKFQKDQEEYNDLFDRFFDEKFFSSYNDPFAEMERLHKELEKKMNKQNEGTFTRFWNSWFGNRFLGSSEDIYFQQDEKKDFYVITLRIPNLKQNKLNLKIEKNEISINGEFSQIAERKDKKGTILSKSEIHKSIFKTFPIPSDANYKKATIKSEQDKIIITIPKIVST